MKIEYVNSSGASIVLNSGHYLVSGHDLRDFAWERKVTNRPSGFGGRVSFTRPVQEKTISIGIRGRELFAQNAAALMALTETDILNNTPGRLYLGDQYLICYLAVASKINRYAEKSHWVSKDLTVLVVEPFWRTEKTYRFLSGAVEDVENAKRYDLRYDYRYIASASSGSIINDHYAPSQMIITVYGAAENPSITVGGNIYSVQASVSTTQRIVIDQLQRKIESVSAAGDKTNLFDYRDKENDIFTPVPSGVQTVIYDGTFDFDITLIQQRSEPKWT